MQYKIAFDCISLNRKQSRKISKNSQILHRNFKFLVKIETYVTVDPCDSQGSTEYLWNACEMLRYWLSARETLANFSAVLSHVIWMFTSYMLYECSCDTCDLIQHSDWFAFLCAKPITERFTSVPQAFSRPLWQYFPNVV